MQAADRPIANDENSSEAQARRVVRWARFFVLVLIIGMVAILLRVMQLKTNPDPRLRVAAGTPISSRTEMARRGDIQDRRGRTIATSTLGHRLFVDPAVTDDIDTVAVDIAMAIGADPVPLDRKIAKRRRDSRYVVVCEDLEEWQVQAVRSANLAGVGLTPKLVRHYPHGELGAALVGMVGFEHDGLAGMEHHFDDQLRPEHGHLTYLRDARRRALWIDPSDFSPGTDGGTIRLSMDLVIQDIIERRLRQAVAEHNAGGGRIMVIDPRSGEILALSDILNPRPGWDEQTTDPFRDTAPALGRNRCVSDPYEPGSTFKPFVWSVATELGKARPDEVLPTPSHTGHRTSTGRLIREAYYYGPSSWRKVLIKSINAGMAIVAERMTEQQLQDVITRFGFGHRTHCGLPGETGGIVTSPRDWTSYTQCSVAMGHEIAVTPAQMVRGFSAFARDGTLPTLRITSLSKDDEPYQVVQRAITPSTAHLTRQVLRQVMLEGTGRHAQSERYQLFGKSGTAQLPKKEGGGYHQDRYVSSFIAGAPLNEPRIVVLCVIDDPDKTTGYHGGGKVAGPVVRDVIDSALEYLGVAPDMPQTDEDTLASAI